jgi:lipopolysaccharide export system permease protein
MQRQLCKLLPKWIATRPKRLKSFCTFGASFFLDTSFLRMLLNTLDRYIIKKYLGSFFFVALLFTFISVIIDYSQKVDDFVEHKLSLLQVFRMYYIYFIPYINGMLWPLYALISVIFFTSRMAYNAEIIAILAGGVSFYRITKPYILAACILMAMQYYGNNYLIPLSNKQRIQFENTYVWRRNYETPVDNIHLFINQKQKLYIRRYSVEEDRCYDFTMEYFDGKGNLQAKLFATRADWQKETQKWRIINYRIRTFGNLRENLTMGSQADSTFLFTPDDVERRDNVKDAMTTPEISAFIDRQIQRGAGENMLFASEKHRRSADTGTVLILTLIGMSLSSRKIRGGMGLHLALGAGIGALFIIISKFSLTFSIKGGFDALWGAWLPNAMYLFVVIALLRFAQK